MIIHICGPRIYRYEKWFFEVSHYSGPWPLCKNGDPKKKAGKKFFEFYYNIFDQLSDEEKEKYFVGGGCMVL